MKPSKSILVLLLVVAPAIASAQGYYGGGGGGYAPEPGGFHHRANRLTFGGSLGLGVMNDSGDRITCSNCNYNPVAFEADGHIGGMLNSRLALLFEGQVNGQLINAENGSGNGDSTLVQSAAMIAVQYWITPQFWIKGGVGLSHITVDHTYFDATVQEPGADGVAVMAAAGFEIWSARRMAIDLQGRLISGSYDGISDHITGATIGLGISWY
jgi:hypothetical protein